MKKNVAIFIFCLLVNRLFAQQSFNDSISQSRNQLTKKAMITLGTWAIANIGSGFVIASQTTGEAKYAWRMNGYWNFFNLGLAGLGYAGLRSSMKRKYGFADNFKAQQAIEKLYVFNTGLDLAYIAGGFYLREKGNSQSSLGKKDQLKGYGTSIAVQGSFLLLMDAVLFSLHHKNTGAMNNKLRQLEIRSGAGGLGISYVF